MIPNDFIALGEYGAAGMYEEPTRSLFYRKSLGIRRYYENCSLPPYNKELLYPSGVMQSDMLVRPDYLRGMSFDGMRINFEQVSNATKELSDLLISEFGKYHSTVPVEHAVAGNMYTHSIPNYRRIINEGFYSYLQRIQKITDNDIRDGLSHIISGIKTYIDRCVEYLESVSSDKKLIAALKKVPMNPAENIYEAVVAWNFIMYLDNCDNLGCVASGLYPYYRGEDITDLLRNLYDNLDKNNGYSMSLGAEYNPLTLQCLAASKGKRRPMIELFVDESTPDEVWKLAFELIRTNNGQPAFYNRRDFLGELNKKFSFIPHSDLIRFCGGGCTETMLEGLSNVGSLDAGINLLLIFEQTLNESLCASQTFEGFYSAYIENVKAVVDNVCRQISISQISRAENNPLPMRTLLIDDCIDKGIDFNNGGARYKWSIINFAGMINVIDSLLSVKQSIYDDPKYTAEEFISHLKNNDLYFLKALREQMPSFGNDSEYPNALSRRLSTDIFSMLDQLKPAIGVAFLPASIQFQCQVEAGRCIGATPDGRENGAPLCDSLGAIFGKDTEGPTALLKSVTSLDLKYALGTPVFNFNINPDFKNEILKSLILGYMQLGGLQMQITCASAQMLKEAYDHPDMHRNLVVRVGGYSEYFCVLPDDLKKMIINRTIQNMV